MVWFCLFIDITIPHLILRDLNIPDAHNSCFGLFEFDYFFCLWKARVVVRVYNTEEVVM